MKLLRCMAVASLLGLVASIAMAQTLPLPLVTGPQDPSQMNATFNRLINQINGVLVPNFPSPAGAVNFTNMIGAVSGQPAEIALQPGADANAGIQINPNGSGNVILFGLGDTGVLQFSNQASFVSAPGLSPFPGRVPSLAAMQGVSNTVQGVLIVKDWLGVTRGVPAY